MKDLFRVHTADNKIKYTGTIEGSWFFTLESAAPNATDQKVKRCIDGLMKLRQCLKYANQPTS